MDIVYLAFANNAAEPLPTLRKEDDRIHALLSRRVAERHFLLHRESHATLETVADALLLHRDNIVVFHYSGHAGRDRLLLEDGETNATGIAQQLAQCPRLQLVVLNGCSTAGQIDRLLELGVPAVVGTSAPVEDRAATQFSISFFQAFAERRDNIRDSFQAGLAAAQAAATEPLEVETRRGPHLRSKQERPLWALMTQPGHEVELEWKLPQQLFLRGMDDYTPNERLIDTLTETLAPYNETLADMLEEEALGGEPSISEKQDIILKSLPYPISDHLRKLLAPRDDSGQKVVFFDYPGLDRLKQLVVTYNTLVEFLAFIMLGQLWDAAGEQANFQLDAEHSDVVRRFFCLQRQERKAYDFRPLIRAIRQAFDAQDIPYFITELRELQRAFEEQSAFYHACEYLEALKLRIPKKDIGEFEAAQLCIPAEEQLAAIMAEVGFLANYTLTSIIEVSALKYRHRKEVRFRHKLVKLIQRIVNPTEEKKIYTEMLDTASVLLLKNERGALRFLNLSPFIIDDNAFVERAGNVSKLHFFENYETGMDTLLFRHVYKPDDKLLFVDRQKEYRIIKEQFDAFTQLLFQQPIKAL